MEDDPTGVLTAFRERADGVTGRANASTSPERGMLGFFKVGFNFDFDLIGKQKETQEIIVINTHCYY